jgi:hypothetical protein
LTSITWCRGRYFITYTATIPSLTCLCFSSINKFFITCRNVRWRNRSKLSTAKIATLIASLVIMASNIPFLLYFTILQTKTSTGSTATVCSLVSSCALAYVNYILQPVLLSLLPGIILIITG